MDPTLGVHALHTLSMSPSVGCDRGDEKKTWRYHGAPCSEYASIALKSEATFGSINEWKIPRSIEFTFPAVPVISRNLDC